MPDPELDDEILDFKLLLQWNEPQENPVGAECFYMRGYESLGTYVTASKELPTIRASLSCPPESRTNNRVYLGEQKDAVRLTALCVVPEPRS